MNGRTISCICCKSSVLPQCLQMIAFFWRNDLYCKKEFCSISSAFIFKPHHASSVGYNGDGANWILILRLWMETRIASELAPQKHETITELTGNDLALSMKLHFKAESPLEFYCKLQNISIKFPFVNKYDIILMTNWTTTCLSTADPQLFSHHLFTALDMTAGYIFFCVTKTGTNKERRNKCIWKHSDLFSHHTKPIIRNHYSHEKPEHNTLIVQEMPTCDQLCPHCERRCLCHLSAETTCNF